MTIGPFHIHRSKRRGAPIFLDGIIFIRLFRHYMEIRYY